MENKNFIQNPSKKTLIVFTLLALIGWSLLYYASCDDNGKVVKFNLMIGFIVLSNILVLINLYANYFRNKKSKND